MPSHPDSPPPLPPRPTSKALLICQQTILEAHTGNISIINVFTRFILPRLPGRLHPFQVFVQFTNALGHYEVTIEIHDLKDDALVCRSPQISLDIPDRLHVRQVIIPIPPLRIPHPGKYDLIVLANGQEIDRQPFYVDLKR